MTKKIENMIPTEAIHPGEILRDELEARAVTQKEFAKIIGIAYTQLNEIINGKRNISPDLAVLLETALDIDAKYWLSLQYIYMIDKSRIKIKIKEQTDFIERLRRNEKFTAANY